MPFFSLSSPSSGNATQLQSRAVSATAPATGAVLAWSGSAWLPAPGVTGPTGAAGVDGAKIYSGTGAPSTALGRSGDFYIDTTTGAGVLYGPKASNSWGGGLQLQSGPRGPTGPQGLSITGPTGSQGAASTVTGPTGASVTGPTGAASTVPGPTGPQGSQGLSVTGPTGAQGAASTVTGPTGSVGPTGSTGPAPVVTSGPSPDTVYIGGVLVAAAQGPTGPQGNSITGPTGAASNVTGPTGASVTGPTGAAATVPGPTGPQGNSITGPTGSVGPASQITGPTGQQGNSITGPTGAVGATGATGAQGLAASVVYGVSSGGSDVRIWAVNFNLDQQTNPASLTLSRALRYQFVPYNVFVNARIIDSSRNAVSGNGVSGGTNGGETLTYIVPLNASDASNLKLRIGAGSTFPYDIPLKFVDGGPIGPTGPASTVPGPTGATGDAGQASTVPGPTGATGPASTVPGPTGPAGGPTGPTGSAGSGGVSLGLVLALS